MGSAATSCGEGQPERVCANSIGAGHRPADDNRTRYLAKSEAILVAAIEVNVPNQVIARTAIGDFQSVIRSKTARKLDEWLTAAKNSLVGSFAGGVEKDLDAVRNAILSPWSNGQTEGQITALVHE